MASSSLRRTVLRPDVSVAMAVIVEYSSIRIGDRELLRGVERDDRGPGRREDHFFLDPGSRDAVARGTVRLHPPHHPRLTLARAVQRAEPAETRPLGQAKPRARTGGTAAGGTLT